jgi:hypothetical protein
MPAIGRTNVSRRRWTALGKRGLSTLCSDARCKRGVGLQMRRIISTHRAVLLAAAASVVTPPLPTIKLSEMELGLNSYLRSTRLLTATQRLRKRNRVVPTKQTDP